MNCGRARNVRLIVLTFILGMAPVLYTPAAANPPVNTPVPANLLNNQFYLESVKYLGMAKESYDTGEYRTAEDYAREAMKYAALSDEYVNSQLKIRDADQALANAKARYDWAGSIGANTKFPRQYAAATTAYTEAGKARTAEKWDDVIAQANKVLAAVNEIEDLNNQQQADAAIAKAKERIDWANSIDAKNKFPTPYNQASTAFTEAQKARTGKKWADVTTQTNKVIAAVAEIEKLKNQQDAADQKKSADAIANAKKRLDWATSIGAKTAFPEPYGRAETAYAEAGKAQTAKQYDSALAAANRVIDAVAEIERLKNAEDARLAQEKQRLEEEARLKAEQDRLATLEEARAAAVASQQEAAETARARQEAAEAIANAKGRLDWAVSIGAIADYTDLYNEAAADYDEAVRAQAAGDYAAAAAAAGRVISTVNEIERRKAAEAESAVAAARERLDQAAADGTITRFPDAYNEARGLFNRAETALAQRNWPAAIALAREVLRILDNTPGNTGVLPARYRVRTWANERDCLWNIAAYPWVYNDPLQWRRLYDANRSSLPEEANPDLILPEMILEIPSIRGEYREGFWEPGREYGSVE